MEPATKHDAEGVLHNLGISPTEAIRIFYRQITLRRALPFAVAVPNDTTATTLEKSRRNAEVQEFETLDAMFKSWEK
jgi:DNA-damage-inducible protein J